MSSPHPPLNFLFFVTTMVVWGELNAPLPETNDTIPVDGHPPSSDPLALSRTLDVAHIWRRTLRFLAPLPVHLSPETSEHPPPSHKFGSFYWFDCPRVGRWRTSKRCSPMSVIWWRWRKASLLQRPGRVRKSSYPSQGKHVVPELSCCTAAPQPGLVCLSSRRIYSACCAAI